MRNTTIAAFVAVILSVTAPLPAQEMAQPSFLGYGNGNPYTAGACAAPEYGALGIQSGCCEDQSCCNNVWDGYCQEKHQGIKFPCIRQRHRMCMPTTAASCSACGIEPEAAPPEDYPTPQPEKSSKVKPAPTPAPKLPPPPETSKELKPEKAESKSPSDKAEVSFPLFNPASWKIGRQLKW